MILSTIILLLLLISVIRGYRIGLLSMVISVLTYFISYFGAKYLAPLTGNLLMILFPEINHSTAISGESLASLNFNQFFYRGIAFIISFTVLTMIIRVLLRRLKWLARLPILGTIDRWIGAAIDLIICYVIIFIVLMVFQLYPAEWWQVQLANSEVAQLVIKETPFLTQTVINLLG